MRRWVPLFLSLVVLFTLVAPVAAQAEIQVIVGGAKVSFDVPPVNKDGRVLVPLRAIGEALGFTVGFDSATKTVSLVKPGTEIILVLGSQEARVNGQVKTLDVPAQAMNGRTLVPVRFVAENLGATVSWDPATQTVTVTPRSVAVTPPSPLPTTPPPAPAPTQPAGSPEALALLAQTEEAGKAQADVRAQGNIEMNMVMSTAGMSIPFEMGIALDMQRQGQNMLLMMEITMPAELGAPGGTIAMALKDGLLYMQEDGGGWVYVDEVSGEEMPSLSELGLQDPTAFQELISKVKGGATVKIVGTEVVDGVNTTVLELKIAKESLTDLTAEVIAATGLQDTLGADESLSFTFGDLYVKMWVNPATGFTHRIVEELHMTMSGGDASGTMEMVMDLLADLRMTPAGGPIQWPELPPKP